MKKVIAALVAMMALVAVTVAVGLAQAADLQANFVGSNCGGLSGAYHFVNNQTGGGSANLITTWSTAPSPVSTPPSVVNNSVTQYNVTHDGTLLSAHTSLGGKIVISDLVCASPPPPPPPPPPPVIG